MNPERSRQAEDVFKAAVELPGPQRAAFLAQRCHDDRALHAEVELLLKHHDKAESFLESPPLALVADVLARISNGPPPLGGPLPERIGSYQILEVLGSGGMGVVYRARQERPQRIVALKLIRAGVASERLLRRFEHEAQVLGRLQHPGIAQVFEAGTADTGQGQQPYFAMELVCGRPLTTYATEQQLGTRARLELLAAVCDAVHHAHQKGVIHRDLKPSNILVDGAGQPKILDFGIARVTDSDVQAGTVQTDLGLLVGTMPYMSPEQCLGDPHELDIRSDVYALGVMAYELLTGRLPHDLQNRSLPEAVRIILEEVPPRPSAVRRVLRGDIETIVSKALDKEKSRRYQSASDLAADIRRFLRDEPILARPASSLYRLRKFARRNKVLVAAAAGVVLALSAGVIGTSWQAQRARQAERIAERRRIEAERQAALAWQVQRFLQTTLTSLDPEWTLGRDVQSLREVVDEAARTVVTQLAGQPDAEAVVRETIGLFYRSLGQLEEAETHLLAAVNGYTRTRGEAHPQTLTTMRSAAAVLRARGKLDAAEQLFARTLEGRRRVLGEEHFDTSDSLIDLADVLLWTGRADEAEPLFARALDIRRRLLGDDHVYTIIAMHDLGRALHAQCKLDQAEGVLRSAVDHGRAALSADNIITLTAMREYGDCLADLGCYADAEAYLLAAYSRIRAMRGERFSSTVTALGVVIRFYDVSGQPEQAAHYRRLLPAADPGP